MKQMVEKLKLNLRLLKERAKEEKLTKRDVRVLAITLIGCVALITASAIVPGAIIVPIIGIFALVITGGLEK
jgi:hypothetical protein